MKSDSELMNELAHKTNYLHEMTSSESSAMKRALLDIYRDVAKLCEKEGLTLMLSGGSCLGLPYSCLSIGKRIICWFPC